MKRSADSDLVDSEEDNVALLCKGHAPKVDKALKKYSKSAFLGRHVKKAFRVVGPGGSRTFEHMWVQVTSVRGGKLYGRLANIPAFKTRLALGARVCLTVSQIEEVLPPLDAVN